MSIQSPAIVLHSLRYGESDLIVSLFTKTSGLKSYLLKGVLKSKRAKIKAALFQPLTLLEVEVVHKNKGTLERIREAKVLVPYATLHTDVVKSAIVFFISEVLHNSIREEESNEALFEFIKTALLWLDTHDATNNFHVLFLIKLTQYLGFYPDISEKTFPFFNMLEGRFQSVDSNQYCVQGDHIEMFKNFLGTTFDEGLVVRISRSVRKDILSTLLVYFVLHLHSFKKPKSISILNEIFK